ncbi:MAG: hypothetical protein HOH43_01470 [Candidatus Latescibacteria bacterium]|jgi:hypothetical protein|nr:hypothetical protein [Candidatus Latescibacterota bacterium]
MLPEDRLLFTLTGQRFTDVRRARAVSICKDHRIQWDYVYETAFVHGVAPLVAHNLLSCLSDGLTLPHEMLARWMMSRQQSMDITKARDEILSEALAYFDARDIGVMLIKGAALDLLVYDEPWYTLSEDIDIILNVRKQDLTDTSDQEIVDLFRPLIEHDYFEHHDLNLNGLLPIDFNQIWDRAQQFAHGDSLVFVPSPEDMLLSVCINSFRKRFFSLKNLCDVTETVTYLNDQDLDYSRIVPLARSCKCENIVYTALYVAGKYMDCQIPESLLSDLRVNSVRSAAIAYLVGRQSFSNLAEMHSGRRIMGRTTSASALLPGAVYRWDQILQKMLFIWRSRKLAKAGWYDGIHNLGTDLGSRRTPT